jgi:hypothetical protein
MTHRAELFYADNYTVFGRGVCIMSQMMQDDGSLLKYIHVLKQYGRYRVSLTRKYFCIKLSHFMQRAYTKHVQSSCRRLEKTDLGPHLRRWRGAGGIL